MNRSHNLEWIPDVVIFLDGDPANSPADLEQTNLELAKALPKARTFPAPREPDEIFGSLMKIGLSHPDSLILRVKPHGRPLHASLFTTFLRSHLEGRRTYSYMDLEELGFYHTLLEVFPAGVLREIDRSARKTIPPDHILNAFDLPGAGSFGLPAEEARRFMERFETFFPLPIGLNLEISSRCNSRCVMCHFDPEHGIGLVDDPPPFMPFPLFQKIADEVSAWPRKPCLDFCWRGEPLMNPDFGRYLRYAAEKGLQTLMTTNGSLLSAAASEELLDVGLGQLVVSIDGADAVTYENIRRGLRYREMKENLIRFLELRAERNGGSRTATMVKTCLQEENEGQEEEIVGQWLPLVDHVVVQNKGIYDRGSRRAYSYKVFAPKEKKGVPCPQPFLIQSITAGGNVYDCLLVYSRKDPFMGNCTARSLEELWKGETIAAKRKSLLEGRIDELPSCGGCEIPSTSATLRHEIRGNTLIRHKHFYRIYSKIQEHP
jgi:MoaA/NifB/PqqE/SkfB family radical SAM enzyme